jgi:hypothetical protein
VYGFLKSRIETVTVASVPEIVTNFLFLLVAHDHSKSRFVLSGIRGPGEMPLQVKHPVQSKCCKGRHICIKYYEMSYSLSMIHR